MQQIMKLSLENFKRELPPLISVFSFNSLSGIRFLQYTISPVRQKENETQ